MRLYLPVTLEAILVKSYQHASQTWAEQDNTNEHAKLHGESTRRPVPYMNNYSQLKKTGSRIGSPPGKTHRPQLLLRHMKWRPTEGFTYFPYFLNTHHLYSFPDLFHTKPSRIFNSDITKEEKEECQESSHHGKLYLCKQEATIQDYCTSIREYHVDRT